MSSRKQDGTQESMHDLRQKSNKDKVTMSNEESVPKARTHLTEKDDNDEAEIKAGDLYWVEKTGEVYMAFEASNVREPGEDLGPTLHFAKVHVSIDLSDKMHPIGKSIEEVSLVGEPYYQGNAREIKKVD